MLRVASEGEQAKEMPQRCLGSGLGSGSQLGLGLGFGLGPFLGIFDEPVCDAKNTVSKGLRRHGEGHLFHQDSIFKIQDSRWLAEEPQL